jgi:antitoxin FitA
MATYRSSLGDPIVDSLELVPCASIEFNAINAGDDEMSSLTVRNIDDAVKARLRVRAAENGRSMEAEARAILRSTLLESGSDHRLGSQIHARFAALGGAEIDFPRRIDPPRAADLSA